LILDEAVSNLDQVLQAGVLALLKKRQQQSGTACLFITHDLRLVERFCQRVMVMEEGRIVETQLIGEALSFTSSAGKELQQAILPALPVRGRAASSTGLAPARPDRTQAGRIALTDALWHVPGS
jgi:nickel transport system ATP-binding protein